MSANKYNIREICGDWALDMQRGNKTITLFFNSRNNAELVKAILEWEDNHPNEAAVVVSGLAAAAGNEKAAKYYELFKAGLDALRPITREQVEKVWRGEWVKRHKHRGGFRRVKGFDDMGEQHEVTIDERCEYDDLYCSKCGKQSPDNFLNFCGYCGAPMTDEAVQMVMERLEALYGKTD